MPRKKTAKQRLPNATSFKKGDVRAKRAGEKGNPAKKNGRPPNHAKRAIDAALRAEIDGEPCTRDIALHTLRLACLAKDELGNPTHAAVRASLGTLAYTDKLPEQPVAIEGSMKGAKVVINLGR